MIRKFIYFIFTNLINLNLYFIKKKYKSKLIYNQNASFGESLIFNILNYDIIISKKKKLIIFSSFEKRIAEFFFKKEHMCIPLVILPKFIPVYQLSNELKKKENFKIKKFQTNNFNKKIFEMKHSFILNDILHKRYDQINPDIKFFKKKKFILIFIKHYNKNNNDIDGSCNRQTSDLDKIFLMINFILKKKVKIIIMGNQKDKSVNIIEKKIKNKNLFFFKNLSPGENLIDQLFLHKYSQFGIGNDGGVWTMSFFFRKRIFLFDTCISSQNKLYKKYKNIIFMPKKITFENRTEYQTLEICNRILKKRIPYKVNEVPLKNIINQIKKYL